MRSTLLSHRKIGTTCRVTMLLAVCLLLAFADAAFAQRRGVGGRAGRQPPKTSGPTQKQVEVQTIDQPGSYRGQISKFQPMTDDKDEDLIGVLTIRPLLPGSKILKVQVRKTDNLRIAVGGHTFDPESCSDILWKGLYCSAEWDWLKKEGEPEKKKPTIRELRALTFDTLPVEGTVEEMEGEFITLKVKPLEGRDWPDTSARSSTASGRTGTAGETKRVIQKKLRLKVFDDVSAFVDAASQALDVGDFTPEQQVHALVVYGKKQGMLIELRSMTAEERKEAEQKKPTDPKRGERPAGPRGGGRLRR